MAVACHQQMLGVGQREQGELSGQEQRQGQEREDLETWMEHAIGGLVRLGLAKVVPEGRRQSARGAVPVRLPTSEPMAAGALQQLPVAVDAEGLHTQQRAQVQWASHWSL